MFSEKISEIKSIVKSISDDELFELLECASDELKRRNGLLVPGMADIRKQSPEANVAMLIEALSKMGAQVK
jgi:hypothetical protein